MHFDLLGHGYGRTASGDRRRASGMGSEGNAMHHDVGHGDEADFGDRKKLMAERNAADGAEHRAEQVVQVAELVALGRRGLLRRGMPEIVRKGRLLREQHRADEQDASDYLARHSSRPAMNRSFGSFLPMNTRSDCFF